MLNEHNTVFASKRSAICNRCFPGPTRVVNANGISVVLAVFAVLTVTDRQTDRQTTLLGRYNRLYYAEWTLLRCGVWCRIHGRRM